MRSTLLAAAALALAMPAPAQDAAEEPSKEVRAAAERYVQSDAMQTMMDEMMSPDMLSDAMAAQFGDQIPADVMDQIVAIATEEIQAIEPAMEEAMIEATAETFTLEEIEAQIEFYQSQVGASILSKMQPFMATFYEAVTPDMQQAQSRMMQRLEEEVQLQ